MRLANLIFKEIFFKLQNMEQIANLDTGDNTEELNRKIQELEAALEASNEEKLALGEKLLQIKDIASKLSHDLRNPFNSLIGLLQVMIELPNSPLAKKERALLEGAYFNSNIIYQLVENLISLMTGNTISENVELNSKQITLKYLIENTIAASQVIADRKGITIETNFRKNFPEIIFFDNLIINRILSNLLTNAIKFTEADAEKFIEVSINSIDNDYWSMEVKDEGRGIAKEDLERIFEKGEQLRESDTIDEASGLIGEGLGLSIVKQLVEENGGRIEVESTLGEGTIFRIMLPKVKVNFEEA